MCITHRLRLYNLRESPTIPQKLPSLIPGPQSLAPIAAMSPSQREQRAGDRPTDPAGWRPSRPWEFLVPTRIHFGRGTFRKLGDLVAPLGKSALLVGYHEPGRLADAYDRAARALTKAGVSVIAFAEVEPEPDASLVARGADTARQAGVETVVALGGGSAIDAAKAIALVAKLGGQVEEYFLGRPGQRPLSESLPVVAVPTTAGTGAEVSDVAVLGHRVGDMPVKASLYGSEIRPAMAVIDPDLATGSPAELTAACGADALGHAIEAVLSRRANPMATLLGSQAAGLICQHLRSAVANPDDPHPREPLAMAALLAGIAFTASSVTAAHAVAQALGSLLHLPHGVAVALATPALLRHNASACAEPYALLASQCGSTREHFVDEIATLLRDVGLPAHIAPPADAAADLLDRLVENALESSRIPLKLNPVPIDESALRKLFAGILATT
jgi:alcohol dehydrogenase class IV